jgi:hypothetical protein
MTTLHSKEPGLPAWKYPQHVEAILQRRVTYADGSGRTESDEEFRVRMGRPRYIQTLRRGNRSPHILGQNHPEAVGYGRNYRSAGYRMATGLSVATRRTDLRLAGLCALLVFVLCAWMFFNANFAAT